uniref:Uncharacterized protein n=1 Tax=Arundo donax TaxID=35708 RepID=A0A0A9AMT2_ARUDO
MDPFLLEIGWPIMCNKYNQ